MTGKDEKAAYVGPSVSGYEQAVETMLRQFQQVNVRTETLRIASRTAVRLEQNLRDGVDITGVEDRNPAGFDRLLLEIAAKCGDRK